jgi:hypothetical protein
MAVIDCGPINVQGGYLNINFGTLLSNSDYGFLDCFLSKMSSDSSTKLTSNHSITCECKISVENESGKKYWTGTKWSTLESWDSFKIGTSEDDYLYYTWHKVDGKTYYDDPIIGGVEGYVIKLSDDEILYGNLVIEIREPVYIVGGSF